MVKKFIILGLFALSCEAFSRPAVLGDRVLFEIGPHGFTQRQLELHFCVKGQIYDRSEFKEINASNWTRVLQVYAESMQVYAKARNLGRFHPNSDAIDAEVNDILDKLDEPALLAIDKRLSLDRKSLLQEVSKILTISEYFRLQPQTRSRNENTAPLLIRFFQGSESYMPINPRG